MLAMSGLRSQQLHLPEGGGAYALPRVTLGVFLSDQPGHRLSIGADRTEQKPLARREGWLLPAGAEGLCLFDTPLVLQQVEVAPSLLTEAGIDPSGLTPQVGALDPLLVELALQAEEFASGGTLYRETMERALAARISHLAQPPRPEAAALADPRLSRAVDYIHANLGEDLSIAGMSLAAGLSPDRFARAFKAATGASPLQYVISVRIERAKVLLATTRHPVAEIAWRVGYEDVSRFTAHFKRRTGTTPARFRAG